MRASDLMEREVATLEVSDDLGLADDIMRLGRIRHMPVVAQDRVVGILSQRDLFRAGMSSALGIAAAAERQFLGKVSVRSAMTTEVVTIGPEVLVRDAVRIMLERKIGCLPVVEDGRLVGLLSETDCLRYLAHVLDISEQRTELPELEPAG